VDLKVKIGNMELKNPVLTASGTFGYGEEYAEYYDLSLIGGVMMKGISAKPREGNPPPRVFETPSGMLNAIGLQNVGLKKFLKEKLPFIRQYDTNCIANILGGTPGEYVKLARAMDEAGVDGIELNVSCPNVKKGGIAFASDVKGMGRLIKKVRAEVKNAALIVKLSPNITDIKVPAKICEDEGADAISLINTITGMAINPETRQPVLANITGGLSGPAIKPIALRMVWEVFHTVKIPIIGMGGISNGLDAVEFLIAGASAIAVGTANFITPEAAPNVVKGIETYMKEHGVKNVSELTGSLRIPLRH
jgi:dihydroorotate dehydrogenase (NAD+) catalytic subunit